jgi:4-diphosphocytidyl-2-C-methyl-D-erythritol kinase
MTGSESVTVRAPAKINLVLSVGAARPDGFHPLDTIYQAVSLYDDVTATEADTWSVDAASDDVDLAGVPLDDRNIALRAGRLLAEHHGIDRAAHLHIAKGIPVAGGMAGGSADAAATLVALDRLWSLETDDDDLLALAARLGSDVPFALVGGTARGTGRGEVVTPLADDSSLWWVVVPDFSGLSTPEVYAEFDVAPGIGSGRPAPDWAGLEYAAIARSLRNDLQDPALRLRPDLAETRDALTGAGVDAALLSGSGPTYLGLVRDREAAHDVVERLAADGVVGVRIATGPVAGAHVVEYV